MKPLIWGEPKAEYFSRDIWTGVTELKTRLKSVFLAQGILRLKAPAKAPRQTTIERIRARRANHDPSSHVSSRPARGPRIYPIKAAIRLNICVNLVRIDPPFALTISYR
jgi:hypothetical protein